MAKMLPRTLRAALPAMLAGALGLPLAHADIYTWADASGAINVSNLPPPEGVRVTNIVRAPPPEIVAREEAAGEAARKAETQALAERVRQLEDAVAARQAPRADYRPIPSPPLIQYVVEPAPPPMQQIVEMAPPAYAGGCDFAWGGCGLWWASDFYPATVIVLRASTFRPFHAIHGGNNFNVHPPGRFFGPAPGPRFAAPQSMTSLGSPQRSKRG